MPILTLSFLGVAISAGLVAFGMHLFLGWPVQAAVIFGALIAATDPVAVIALFKDLKIGGRARLLIESESLFNDGVAAVLFGLALSWAAKGMPAPAEAIIRLITMSGGGVLVGLAIGGVALLIAGRTGDHLVETAVTVVAAYGAFLIAENLGFSGVLATVAAGFLVGAAGLRAGKRRLGLSLQGRNFALEFWEFLAFIANSLVFLLIGVTVSRLNFSLLGYMPLLVAIVLVLAGRAASVYPISLLFRRGPRRILPAEQHLLWWAGLRGALALALALSLPTALGMRDAIVMVSFGVVIFSVIVQGLTMPALVRRLGLSPSEARSKQ